MSDENNGEEPTKVGGESFSEMIGRNFGGLMLITLLQTRALIELTSALKADPGVSEETRAKALKAAELVDGMISESEKLLKRMGTENIGGIFDGR